MKRVSAKKSCGKSISPNRILGGLYTQNKQIIVRGILFLFFLLLSSFSICFVLIRNSQRTKACVLTLNVLTSHVPMLSIYFRFRVM